MLSPAVSYISRRLSRETAILSLPAFRIFSVIYAAEVRTSKLWSATALVFLYIFAPKSMTKRTLTRNTPNKANKNNVSMVDLLRLVNFILLPLYDNDGRGNIITFIDVIDNEFFLVIY